MTAILEEEILTRAPVTPMSEQGADLAATAVQQSSTGEALKAMMPELVKGAGFAPKGGNQPLSDQRDITLRAAQAVVDIRNENARGWNGDARKGLLTKGMNSGFLNQYGALRTALSTPSLMEQLSQVFQQIPGGAEALAKSFTAGNLGIGSVSGFVPFDLLAPSRLIYPVYTVYRNKFPRPAGQGASRIERLVLGISGSQTAGQGVLDASIPELVQSGGSFSNWPLNLPPSGSQQFAQLNVPCMN